MSEAQKVESDETARGEEQQINEAEVNADVNEERASANEGSDGGRDGASDHEGEHEGEDHEGEDHEGEGHEGEDHEGEDHEGEDHEGEDHEGEDHEGEDHEGEDHEGEDDGKSDEEEYDDEAVYKLKSHRREAPADDEGGKRAERKRQPKRSTNDEDEYVEERARANQESRARRARKSSKQQQQEQQQQEDEQLDDATRERRALEAKIDAALQPSSKRRKKLAGDDLESMQDEVIAHLRTKMRDAALADVESIKEGQPAVHKVRLLPEVVAVLRKGSLADSILDGNLLESVRIWLEPLPDASLPSFEIQKVLFGALVALPIKTIHLRESGLGRVVLFYQKSKRPQPFIKRMAQKLIGDWTRPIIGRSDNYRDKRVLTASFDPREARRTGSRGSSEGPKSSYEEAAARRNRAAIPSSSGISYQVAPVSSGSSTQTPPAQSSASKDSQLRRMKTKLVASGRSGKKKSQVSVEGRGLN